MVRCRLFQFVKDFPMDEVNRFLQEQNLDSTQILFSEIIQKTPNSSALVMFYNDVVSPYVIGTSPANGATSVPLDIDIIVQMSESVQPIGTGDVEVLRNGVLVTGAVATDGPKLTLSNFVDGTYGASYVVTLKNSIQDLAGNTMAHPHVFSFVSLSEAMGMSIRSGIIVPGTGEIAQGYADVAFGTPMSSSSYSVLAPGFGGSTPGHLEIPHNYDTLDSPQSTTNASFEDVSGLSCSITLREAAHIEAILSYGCATTGAASSSTYGVRIVIDSDNGNERQRYMSGTNDLGAGAVQHEANLAAGTYTIKVQHRRVAGAGTPQMVSGELSVHSTEVNIPFRVTNKQTTGFRMNFDFDFPLGGSIDWMAILGAVS